MTQGSRGQKLCLLKNLLHDLIHDCSRTCFVWMGSCSHASGPEATTRSLDLPIKLSRNFLLSGTLLRWLGSACKIVSEASFKHQTTTAPIASRHYLRGVCSLKRYPAAPRVAASRARPPELIKTGDLCRVFAKNARCLNGLPTGRPAQNLASCDNLDSQTKAQA